MAAEELIPTNSALDMKCTSKLVLDQIAWTIPNRSDDWMIGKPGAVHTGAYYVIHDITRGMDMGELLLESGMSGGMGSSLRDAGAGEDMSGILAVMAGKTAAINTIINDLKAPLSWEQVVGVLGDLNWAANGKFLEVFSKVLTMAVRTKCLKIKPPSSVPNTYESVND